MKLNKILMSAVLLVGSLGATAQETRVEYNYVPNWYVGAQGGAQYTLGEVSFGDLVSPNAQVLVGYNFNPVLGLRLGVNAWQSKGGIKSDYYGFKEKWAYNYVAPNLDLTIDLTNLIGGFNPNRVVSAGILGGVGANIAWNNKEAADASARLNALYPAYGDELNQNIVYLWDGTKIRLQGRFGAYCDFRLGSRWKLGLEVNANILNDRYNSKKAKNADWYFNALAGVKYTFGKTHTKKVIEIPKPEPVIIEKIVEKIVEKPVPMPVENKGVKVNEEEVKPLRIDVFFTISSTTITKAEDLKVQEVVSYMKKYPNSKVEVTGYADKGTGSAKGNLSLSQRRAAIVVAALKKAGISESRITSDYKGDTEQPFEVNNMNRVTICIAK